MRIVVAVALAVSAMFVYAQDPDAPEDSQEWRGKFLIEEENEPKEIGYVEDGEQPLPVGDSGVWAGKVEVLQVVDANEAHLEMKYYESVTSGRPPQTPFHISEIGINFTRKGWRLTSSGQRAIARGFDFSKVADGAPYEFSGPIKVTKMETYDTTIGSTKRVPVIEPGEPEPLKLTYLRKWTSHVGTTLEAQYYGYEKGILKLMKPDREVVELKLSQLSDDDKEHVRELIAEFVERQRENRVQNAKSRRR